jgi:hypothetical protein
LPNRKIYTTFAPKKLRTVVGAMDIFHHSLPHIGRDTIAKVEIFDII